MRARHTSPFTRHSPRPFRTGVGPAPTPGRTVDRTRRTQNGASLRGGIEVERVLRLRMRVLAAALLLTLGGTTVLAQAERPEVPVHADPVVQGVQAHLNRLCERHDARLQAIKTREPLEAELKTSRARFVQLLGFDLQRPRRVPPVRKMETLDCGTYTIEKLVLETEPGVPVPCNLYVPKGGSARKPAILSPHGHSGRDRPVYQNAYQRLVKSGFLVLAKDGWGKQERRSTGHGAEGGQLFLTGSSLMGLELWDNIRCVDYLLSRTDVDPDRLGMAGISGGGSQTLYTMAIEPRLKAGSPTCAVTTFRADLADTTMCVCEMLHDLLTVGDHGLFLAMAYPRPLLVVNGTRDPIFPVAGARAASRQAQRLYATGGQPAGVQFAEFDADHTWNDAMLDRQIAWFRAQFGLPALSELPPGDGFREYRRLECYPAGRIPAGALTLTELNRKRMSKPRASGTKEEPDAELQRRIRERWTMEPLAQFHVARQDLGPDTQKLATRFRLTWPSALGGNVSATVSAPLVVPPGPRRLVVRLDRDRQVPQFERLAWDDQVRTRATVVELAYTGRGLTPVQEGQVGSALLVAGRSLLAERVRDLLVLRSVLETHRLLDAGTDLSVYGYGFDGVVALAAAPFLPEQTHLVLDRTPITYREGDEIDFTTPDLLAPPAHWTILPGLARHGDLADFIPAAGPRPVLLLSPLDSAQQPLTRTAAERLARPSGRGKQRVELLPVSAGRRALLERLVDAVAPAEATGR